METTSGGNVSGSKYSSVKYYNIPSEINVTPNQDGEFRGAGFSTHTHRSGGVVTQYIPKSGEHNNHRSGGVATQYVPKSGERLNFQIPRKNKENRALFQYVSSESREFEDILTILSSSYQDASSNGAYAYTKPRLIHSEQLEKDFVEKRKELKQDGRTEKELEETHGFLLSDHIKLPWTCEKGLSVGHSCITALGNPAKGVYLSKYSDLLQSKPFNPGVMGEIIIFKVIKGKVKSIYDNMSKNLLDPTPNFDSHFSKNASKVTSITSYRAYEQTQRYFYEYDFDELRVRPRHVCPYAVVSFQFKSKDALLKAKPLAPLRSNSQTPDGSKDRSKYMVWSGELVNDCNAVCRVSFCSFSPPFLPFRLPEKLELHLVMRMDQVTRLIPSALFSSSLYAGSHEVMKNGMYCNLLEVVDNSKSGDVLKALIQSLEDQRLVLVHMLTDKGVLFLLSSGQMATQSERCDGWKNCLQALFVFQESRDVAKYGTKCPASQDHLPSSSSHDAIMPKLKSFVPALHHALVKVRCNPPADISAGVENQARDYLSGLCDGKLHHIPITEYDAKLDDQDKLFPAPKQPKLNIEGYLRSYIYTPKLYAMPVTQANELVERYCIVPEDFSPVMTWKGAGASSRELALEVKPTGVTSPQHPAVKINLPPQSLADTNTQKMKEMINVLQAHHTKAEADVRRKGEAQGVLGLSSRPLKRKFEWETINRTLKYVKKTSWEIAKEDCRTAKVDQSPLCLSAVLQSFGLRAVDLSTDRSETAVKLLKMLNCLKNAEAKQIGWSREGTEQTDGPLFDRMIQLGLPVNQDIDLRKRTFEGLQDKSEVLEEQITGQEGFSSNSEAPKLSQSQPQGGEQIQWVMIPITGLKSQKYCQRKKDNPEDPRFIPQVPIITSCYSLCIPEHLPETTCDTTEFASKHKESTNQNHFQIPVGPEGNALPRRSSSSTPPEEPSPTFPMDVEKQAVCDMLAENLRRMYNGQLEGEAKVKDETVKNKKNKEMEDYVEPEASEVEDYGEEDKEEAKVVEEENEDLAYKHAVSVVDEEKRMEGVADDDDDDDDDEKVLDGSEIKKDEKQEQPDVSPDQNIPLTQKVFPDQNAYPVYKPALPPGQPPLQPFSEYISFYNRSSLPDRMCTVIDTQEEWVTGDPPQGLADIHHHIANQAPKTTYNWNHYLGPDFQSYPNNPSPSPFIPDGSNSYRSQAASQFPSALSQCNSSSGSNTFIMPSLGFPVPGIEYCHARPLCNEPAQTGLPLPQVSSSGAPLPVHPMLTDTNLESVDSTATPNNADLDDRGLQETYPPHTGGLFDSKDRKVIGESSVSLANAMSSPLFRPMIDSLSIPMVDSVPGSGQAQPKDVSSLISKLKPELFTNLVEIIKDVQRNTAQFSHYTKEYFQWMGNIECSPVSVLETENHNLLVLIEIGKDIASHINKVGDWVRLKKACGPKVNTKKLIPDRENVQVPLVDWQGSALNPSAQTTETCRENQGLALRSDKESDAPPSLDFSPSYSQKIPQSLQPLREETIYHTAVEERSGATVSIQKEGTCAVTSKCHYPTEAKVPGYCRRKKWSDFSVPEGRNLCCYIEVPLSDGGRSSRMSPLQQNH
ncbi:hypothetical protein UPYG_G00167040 [Umbra pygmaea]|uniref:TASOR pseudo-PARP domain-containing protein n=1 Tax=Umbra pygmaea TaxID=75934 RepID=A0ABD0WST6_UMBPY